MADLTALTAILGSVKTATEIAKLLKDSDLSLEKAEMKLKLAELVSALADAKIELAEVQELISSKDKKIKELEEAFEVKKNLIYEPPYYWLNDKDGKKGSFCQQCYDKEKTLIRLYQSSRSIWECKTCKNFYKDSNYRDPSPDGGSHGWDAFT